MRGKGLWLGLVLTGLAAVAGTAQSQDLVVHEWGTFLAMQGADGVTLDGMYHEEHALPSFVHARSTAQLRVPQMNTKGETPVIYFYTGRPQSVAVKVDFPQGFWTQWYPQARDVRPGLFSFSAAEAPRNGTIDWHVELMPGATPPLPPAGKDALWNFSREVDAVPLRTRGTSLNSEYERFLFYRGLGRATLPLTVTTEAGGTLKWSKPGEPAATDFFVLRVEGGKGAYRYVPSLTAGTATNAIPTMEKALPLKQFVKKVEDELAGRLTAAGLYPKEARAMVNTWSTSYFQNDGVRVLFLMPQAWTDRFIPMQVEPRPRELVRVMVGRVELLMPERERRVEQAIRDLASANAGVRERAFKQLREQGRYVEPIVRRVLAKTSDERTRALCQRLLLTDFVTELRAAVHDAANGKRIDRKPGKLGGVDIVQQLRGQLASLLREVGLEAEAKAEAAPVLAHLRDVKEPAFTSSSARHYLRTRARALEASGDDAAAAQAYAKFVRYGAQVKTCGGCHASEGPRNMAWYRDWWAGRKLAAAMRRAGMTERTIQESEQALARNGGDTGAQMLLAYLYAEKGQRERSEQMWARVEPVSRQAAGR